MAIRVHVARFTAFTLALLMCLGAAPKAGSAWGHDGHLIVSWAGASSLPNSVPAFLRTPQAVREIELLGPEADLLKGSGKTVGDDDDPGHYADIDDDGTIKGMALGALPVDRETYDTQLRAAGSNQYKNGYLPYSLIDGFQIIQKDFAYWRVETIGAQKAGSAADREEFGRLRTLREALTIRDLGYWSHFVGDGSQPLHVSVHYDGWEPRYPGSKGIHAHFETDYVHDFVSRDAVRALIKPFAPCGCTIQQATAKYLSGSVAQVIPLYELFKAGAFVTRTDAGVKFTTERLAYGASEFRDLIVEAWIGSEDASVGYPAEKVRDFENGTIGPILGSIDGG